MLNVDELKLSNKDIIYILKKAEGDNILIIKEGGTLKGYVDKRGNDFFFFELNESYNLSRAIYYILTGNLGTIKNINILNNTKKEDKLKKYFKLKNLYK